MRFGAAERCLGKHYQVDCSAQRAGVGSGLAMVATPPSSGPAPPSSSQGSGGSSSETGPTAPTVGAMIGTTLGLYLASLTHADPFIQGTIVTVSSAVLAAATHLLFAKFGIPDPFL